MKDNDMFGSTFESFMESINGLPPIMKLPTLLVLADEIKRVLPSAEKEYAAEKDRMMNEFIAVLRRYV